MKLIIMYGLSILSSIAYGLMMQQYSQKIISLKVNKVLSILYTVTVSVAFGCLSFQDVPYYYIYCTMYITFLISYYLGFEGRLPVLMFASGNFLFHLLCIKGIIVSVMALGMHTSMDEIITNDVTRSLSTVLLFSSASVFLIAFRRVYAEEKINLFVQDIAQVKFITLTQCVMNIILIFATQIYYYKTRSMWLTIYHLLLAIMMLIGFYVIFRYCIGVSEQKALREKEEVLEYQVQSQLEQYKKQSVYIKELRRLKHDYSNQIKGMRYILETGEYEKALEYAREMDGKISVSSISYVQFSNHGLIDAIFQEVSSKAQERQIQFEAQVSAEHIPFTDLEVCTVFSNLMNNAVEACMKVEGARFIHAKSKLVSAYLIIKVENSFDGKFKLANGRFETMKRDKSQHGLGLETVERIVKNYSGEVEIRPNADEQVFEVFLLIPLAESDKKQ